ncbi:MAG TPA: extracellular solute-binding protein [Anaerolineaceae bacterium]|nr:extracellular solute-binding protein [Anaerolineaceae bacterium]HPN52885.1 extracellular solute-binding protein [Anaerolineaceae bacterium]
MVLTGSRKARIHLILINLILSLVTGCVSPATPLPPPSALPPTPVKERSVSLVMGSWRTDDVEQMNRILAKFHESHSNITIQYDPTIATEYDAALLAQLEAGTGPDLFYLRSYAISRSLYDKGYLLPLDSVPGLKENFSIQMRAPWATDDGISYGMPYIATGHGIYYNQDLFNKLNIEVPGTWEDLMAAAEKIKAAGYIPFANATGDSWTMAELVFMNVAPNFIGGYDGRMAYLSGNRCFNDAHIVAAFQGVKDLSKYFPDNQAALKYGDSQQLFLQGKAAMWLSGSWDILFFESNKPAFAWNVFAPPPPKGQPPYFTFHLDAGMGVNASSQYKKEALEFMEWMTTQEFASLLGNEFPGFFPMHSQMPPLTNAHAQSFLALKEGRGTDVRFAWEKIRDGSPSAYDLIESASVDIANGIRTPQQAADALQAGLAKWFIPAQNCQTK